MAHSLTPRIEEEIDDACDFLVNNEKVIINDLRKEFAPRINRGRAVHKGFKLRMFEDHLVTSIKQRIREMYTFEKRWYITTETAMLIESSDDVIKIVNELIKEIVK